jgi:deoxycytidylate deaminase
MRIQNALTECIHQCSHQIENRPHSLHGAAIIGKKGRVIATGYNHHRNQCSRNNPRYFGAFIKCSFHAEMDAIFRFLGSLPKSKEKCQQKTRRKFRSITLVVIRRTREGIIVDSKPCFHCLQTIRRIGIRKIVYSTPTGKLEYVNTKDPNLQSDMTPCIKNVCGIK